MNTNATASIGMNYRYRSKDPTRRIKGLVIVIALHAFMGYALVSGMARKGLNFIKKPLEAVVIQEVIIPPPPPPPPPPKKIEPPKEIPKVEAPPPPYVPPPDIAPPVTSNAPAIASTTVVPKAPVVIAPPPPPAPPAPPAPKPAANRNDIAVACPKQVRPEMPRKAQQEGIEGVVKAQIRIKGGVVQEVTILSGPRLFHSAVKDAMMQYKCVSDGFGEVIATQEFNFKLE